MLIITRLHSLFEYADVTAVAYGKGEVEEDALSRLVRENESGGIFSEAVIRRPEAARGDCKGIVYASGIDVV